MAVLKFLEDHRDNIMAAERLRSRMRTTTPIIMTQVVKILRMPPPEGRLAISIKIYNHVRLFAVTLVHSALGHFHDEWEEM